MIRAIVFDLDDTLYAEREYAFSGFAAVAREYADLLGDPHRSAADMRRLFDTPDRARVFNTLLDERHIPADSAVIAGMIETYRAHRPVIRLFPDADAALSRLRGQYKLGLITDGPPAQQWAKIDALQLRPRLDEIIVTSELDNVALVVAAADADIHHSTFALRHSLSKPHPLAFDSMSERLGVAPRECVYVADNPQKDFVAPNRLGWLAIRLKRPGGVYEDAPCAKGGEPHAVVSFLDELDGLLKHGR